MRGGNPGEGGSMVAGQDGWGLLVGGFGDTGCSGCGSRAGVRDYRMAACGLRYPLAKGSQSVAKLPSGQPSRDDLL